MLRKIVPRMDCCQERLNGARVCVGDVQVGTVIYVQDKSPYSFPDVNKFGKKVIIWASNSPLALGEVEVYGRGKSWC